MAEAKKQKRLTTYAVFVLLENDAWKPVGFQDAYSAVAAITAIAEQPGEYRAVPEGNITAQAMGFPPPVKPKLQPVDQLKLTEAALADDGFPIGPSSQDAAKLLGEEEDRA